MANQYRELLRKSIKVISLILLCEYQLNILYMCILLYKEMEFQRTTMLCVRKQMIFHNNIVIYFFTELELYILRLII